MTLLIWLLGLASPSCDGKELSLSFLPLASEVSCYVQGGFLVQDFLTCFYCVGISVVTFFLPPRDDCLVAIIFCGFLIDLRMMGCVCSVRRSYRISLLGYSRGKKKVYDNLRCRTLTVIWNLLLEPFGTEND